MLRITILMTALITLVSFFYSGCSAPSYMITPPSQGSSDFYEFNQWHREYKEKRQKAIFDNYFMLGSLGAIVVGGSSSSKKSQQLVGGLGAVGFCLSYIMLNRHSSALDDHLGYGAQKGWVQKTYD